MQCWIISYFLLLQYWVIPFIFSIYLSIQSFPFSSILFHSLQTSDIFLLLLLFYFLSKARPVNLVGRATGLTVCLENLGLVLLPLIVGGFKDAISDKGTLILSPSLFPFYSIEGILISTRSIDLSI